MADAADIDADRSILAPEIELLFEQRQHFREEGAVASDLQRKCSLVRMPYSTTTP